MSKSVVSKYGALFAFLMTLSAGTAFAKDTRIGYVNLSLVFDSYEKTKKFDLELEAQAEVKRREREKIVAEVNKLRDEQELLGEDKKAQKQTQIDEKVKQLQAFDRDARDELRRRRDTMLKEILKEIDDIVKKFGEAEGYAYIFNDRVLVYKDEASDVSQEIIQRLNAGKKP